MIINKPQGRTGNILLQNIGMSIISTKFNLKVINYVPINNVGLLGLKLNQDGRMIEDLVTIYDNQNHLNDIKKEKNIDINSSMSLMDLISQKEFDRGICYDGTFQNKEFVLKHRSEILNHFKLVHSHRDNQVFVHVRLGDVENSNPGLEYYRKSLNGISFINGYISSDSPNHPIVQKLIDEYHLKLFNEEDPIKIINFAKDFENIILSKGTFSWWIAILSKSQNIIFPLNDRAWYGDIFVFDDWKYIDINSL
jgi:hypothetical protein